MDAEWTSSPLMRHPRAVREHVDVSCLYGAAIGDHPAQAGDGLYWQHPARTEAVAAEVHALPARTVAPDSPANVYVAFPWATYIDMNGKNAWTDDGRRRADLALSRLDSKIAYLRRTHALVNRALHVHTVCQHIHWLELVGLWKDLGLTDAWLSHCPRNVPGREGGGLRLHAWPLVAVNVEDPSRTAGLEIGKPLSERKWLASFAGAHMPHYLDDTRLRLADLPARQDCNIRINNEWHFESEVYRRQIGFDRTYPLPAADTVENYNLLLSDSVFSLCPAGAGENTLRLWESLAVGSIPVIFGEGPALPSEQGAASIDWGKILVRVPKDEIPSLFSRLDSISANERHERQQRGMQAYAQIRHLRCF